MRGLILLLHPDPRQQVGGQWWPCNYGAQAALARCGLLVDGMVMERRLRYTNVVIVCWLLLVIGLLVPRGVDGLSASARISARRWIPSIGSNGSSGGGSDRGLQQRRHHPSDGGCPMGGQGLGIRRSGSGYRLTSIRLVLTGQ